MLFLDAIYLAVIGLPWICGTLWLSSYYVSRSSIVPQPRGAGLIAAGVGGCLGYLTLALGAWCFGQIGISIFTPYTAWFLGVLTCCLLLGLSTQDVSKIYTFATSLRFSNTPVIIVSCYVLTLGVLALFHHLWLPILGWDVQDHWAPHSLNSLKIMQAVEFSSLENTHRHPITLNLIIAWSFYWSSQTQQHIGIFLPWLLLYASCYLTIFGYALARTGRIKFACLPALMLTSLPLLENHALIGGYSELFVTSIILGATAIVGMGLNLNRSPYVLLGVLYGFLSISIRNTGIVYALIPLAALCFTYAGTRHNRLDKLLLVVIFPIAYVLCDRLIFNFITPISWPNYDPNAFQVTVFGYSLTFRDTSSLEILQNVSHAYFYNQSFSLMFITCLILTVLLRVSDSRSAYFFIWSLALGVLSMILMQFTSYGFYYSQPENDTALSRFSIPFATLGTLLMSEMLGRVVSKNL